METRSRVKLDRDDPRGMEGLVDVRDIGVRGENYYAREDGQNTPYREPLPGAYEKLLLRQSVATALASADEGLKPFGLRLFVMDGYRPIQVQWAIWGYFQTMLRREYPDFSDAQIDARVMTFVSDPRRFDPDVEATWPLHSTGASVDLTLTGLDGEAIDLGTAFDDASDRASTSFYETLLSDGRVEADDVRLLSRRVLYWTMWSVGFTNYLAEWWHYDLGNQMHIATLKLLGEPCSPESAWYGYVAHVPA